MAGVFVVGFVFVVWWGFFVGFGFLCVCALLLKNN